MSKFGTGHVSAMGRQGLRELRAALYPESNIAQTAEYGLYGTMTPGEVAEARRGETLDLEQETPQSSSVIEQRMPAAGEPTPGLQQPDFSLGIE